MKAQRSLLLAVVAGAVTMFVWGAVSHMVLLKGIGFTRLPREEAVVAEVRRSVYEDGLYFFPGIDLKGSPGADETARWEARFRAGPTGMLLYHPAGGSPLSPKKLLVQLLSDVLAAAVVVYMLSRSDASFWRRVLLASLLGGFAWVTISALYWNWYGFPTAFFLAQGVDKIVGWGLAGTTIGGLLRSPVTSNREHRRHDSLAPEVPR